MAAKKKRKNRRFDRRHVLDVKLRSSHRRQVRLRRAALLLILLTGLGLGGVGIWRGGHMVVEHFIYRNPAFAIEGLDIETDGVVSVEQLRRWSGVERGANLFELDLGRVRRDLELVPVIRSATVERVLPRTLRIRVTEREPVGRFVFLRPGGRGVGSYALDEEGMVMSPLEREQLAGGQSSGREELPRIVGIEAQALQLGRRTGSGQVRAALELLGKYRRSSMVGLVRMREVDVRRAGILEARMEDGCVVRFGLEGFENQLRRWRAVYEHGLRVGRRLLALDLSVSNNLPARWAEGESEPVRGSVEPSVRRRNV